MRDRDKDHNRVESGGQAAHREIDRVLDAALAKYAAVEPRAGLEDRVLANLRAERALTPDQAWWRWSVAATLAAVVVVALALAWRSGRQSHPLVDNHPAPTTPSVQTPATQLAANNGGEKQIRESRVRPHDRVAARKAAVHPVQPTLVGSDNPKLDQFPSPRPLSEQEKLLQSYVAQYPEESILIARARSEALRRDQLEEMKALPSGDWATDADEQNHDTNER